MISIVVEKIHESAYNQEFSGLVQDLTTRLKLHPFPTIPKGNIKMS